MPEGRTFPSLTQRQPSHDLPQRVSCCGREGEWRGGAGDPQPHRGQQGVGRLTQLLDGDVDQRLGMENYKDLIKQNIMHSLKGVTLLAASLINQEGSYTRYYKYFYVKYKMLAVFCGLKIIILHLKLNR